MSNKTAILVLSDPKSGSEESLGRLYNALATAYECKQAGDEVALHFHGPGTRWLGELVKSDHPAFELFQGLRDLVVGASFGCAEIFGSAEDATMSE